MSTGLFAILILSLYGISAAGLIYWSFRRSGLGASAWFLFVLERLYVPLLFHWRSNRRCPFPDRGPALVIANHRSPVDPLLIWMNNHLGRHRRPPRIVAFLTAREYAQTRGLRWLCRAMQTIPVERQGRDMRSAHAALKRLADGNLVGVFPEGRINSGRDLLRGDAGVAWLALHAQVPVYPVFLHGSPRAEMSMVKPFLTPARVRVVFGDPIDLSPYYGRKKTRELLAEVTDLLMRRLAETGGVSYEKDVPRGAPNRDGSPDPGKPVCATVA